MQVCAINLFHFLIWQLMIMRAYAAVSDPPETLILEFDEGKIRRTIQLIRNERVLANEFLPVWISTDNTDMEFEKLNVMEKLGKFTMYHSYCEKSAFVYFHDRFELNGVIDVTYYVKKLRIDENEAIHFIGSKYLHRVQKTGLLSRLIRSVDNTVTFGTRCYQKKKVYPELLVAISHNTFMDIERNSGLSRGIATISHMLTVYNAVDQLYSLVQSVDIQLNIAGIVIEGMPNQWNFQTKSRQFLFPYSYIDVGSIHQKVSEYFRHKQSYFPQHSYDYIIYHTRKSLRDDSTAHILGQAMMSTDGYMFPPDSHVDRFNAVIKDFKSYEHFTTIAHEIAHLFHAAHDREGRFHDFFDMESCEHSLMAVKAHCSLSCLKWSRQTEVEFAEFFRTPIYCNLKNYPRSLTLPEPRVIFSGKEQCQCYGFQALLEYDTISDIECDKPLMCMNQFVNRIEDVPLPMDGTPCGVNKVCWNTSCVNYRD